MAGDVIEEALAAAETWEEARAHLRASRLARGESVDGDLLDAMLVAGCGGDVVVLDDHGQPLHPMARKFAADLGL